MEQAIEILTQIQKLAGVLIDSLQGGAEGGGPEGGPPADGGAPPEAPPEEGPPA